MINLPQSRENIPQRAATDAATLDFNFFYGFQRVECDFPCDPFVAFPSGCRILVRLKVARSLEISINIMATVDFLFERAATIFIASISHNCRILFIGAQVAIILSAK